jgi:hypothetical protein
MPQPRHHNRLARTVRGTNAGRFMSNDELRNEAPWRAGLRAARANIGPGLALQVAALALVLAYYFHAPTHAAIDAIARVHKRFGFRFSIVSTALFGGVIPVLYLRSRAATRHQFSVAGGAALIAFWAYKGFEVDLWYHAQAWIVGSDATAQTIAIKMVLDQFVYCPVLAVPVTVLIVEWIHAEFAWSPVLSDIRAGGWYRRRVLPVLISNLGVWIPAVCIIYALPTALQLPLQNLVLCFWTLLLAHVMQKRGAAVAP